MSYNATNTAVKLMGQDHDRLVRNWTDKVSTSPQQETSNRESGGTVSCSDTSSESESDVEVIPDSCREEYALPSDRSIIVIGDNWDKNIKPRYIRETNQVKSLHQFHSVATVNRIPTMHMDDKEPQGSVRDIALSKFLPSCEDCRAICENYVVLVARVIVGNLKHFSALKDCVPKHIPHRYSSLMQQKTTAVSIL